MLYFALLIMRKDLRHLLARGSGFFQALLLGLLLIFIFSLSKEAGSVTLPKDAAAIFWLASTFCMTLVYARLYAFEENNGVRTGLLLSPYPVQAVWLGKTLAGLLICLLSQTILLPAMFIFLGQTASNQILPAFAGLILADIGMCILGSLLGALGQGHGASESLLSIIFFPLLVPLLLAGISLGGAALENSKIEEASLWLSLLGAFDAIYAACALVCFPFLYRGNV